MLIWHLRTGWRANAIRGMVAEREEGLNSLTDEGLGIVWLGVVSIVGTTALILLLPSVPVWLETTLGIFFILLGFADFVVHRARKSGGYFTVTIGILILAGILL